MQVQRDESSLLVLPYFSDSRRTRQQADTETCLVGYNTVRHESLSDMGTSSRSNIQYQLKRTYLLFLIDCCHIWLITAKTVASVDRCPHIIIFIAFQPSNYEEFTSQLYQREAEWCERLPVQAELVRVDVSGRSFTRLTDYRRWAAVPLVPTMPTVLSLRATTFKVVNSLDVTVGPQIIFLMFPINYFPQFLLCAAPLIAFKFMTAATLKFALCLEMCFFSSHHLKALPLLWLVIKQTEPVRRYLQHSVLYLQHHQLPLSSFFQQSNI